MKEGAKIFLLLLILVLPGFQSWGQTDNQKNSQSIDYNRLGTMVPGELAFKDGKVKKARILYDNPVDLIKLDNQLEVAYMGMEANSMVNKEDLESFTIDGHTWKRITFKDDLQFGIVHLDGAIKNFSVFKIPVVRQTGDYIENMYWQKLEEEPIQSAIFLMRFKKTLISLISDDSELLKKVNNGEPGYKGVTNAEKIIKEYNDWYSTNQQNY